MAITRPPQTQGLSENLTLKSYAKLNLYLDVLNKRKDNYHNIKTIFERIGLYDTITLSLRRDKKIRIKCKNPHVPKDNSNLCYASAKLLQKKFDKAKGVDIEIVKRIPVGAGLGGGSSNAAGVLSGLNKLWKLSLSQKRLADLAKSIGSDAPFFVYNAPFAQGLGRGEKIKPIKRLKGVKLWHILVVPKIKVSTPFIYRKWDEFSTLTRPKYDVKIFTSLLRKGELKFRPESLFNSLERVTASLYPEVKRIKEKLFSLGLKTILMTGSGPAVMAIVSSRKEAVSLGRKLKRQGESWQVFAVSTC